MFFRYYEYEFLLNSKFQIVDVVNALFSKEGKSLNWKNSYSKPLLETIFSQNSNVVIDESTKMDSLITDILTTKDIKTKFDKFNKLRKYINSTSYVPENKMYSFLKFINVSFEDFFNDYYIKNNVLTNDEDKLIFINILINIYKYILVFPKHTKVYNDSDRVKMLNTQIIAMELQKLEADYLKGQWDRERLNDFTSTDDTLVYISSIDSFYHIYKKHHIIEKDFWLLLELYDYLDEMVVTNDTLQTLIKEMANILNYNLSTYYNIDTKNIL